MRAYLALLKIDLKLARRNRTALVFNYVFPLIFFFVFAQAFHADQGGMIMQVFAMVATLGIIGNGLFGAGMRAVQERETNILRRYKVTPISPLPLLVSSLITGLVLYLPVILLILFLSHRFYNMAVPGNLLSLFLFIAIGLAAFRSIGMIIAATVNSMQESVILVQLLYFVMLFLSGASFPTTMFPAWLQDVTQFIPATYLVTGLQGILLHQETVAQNALSVAALLVTLTVGLFAAYKLFRWEKEEKIRSSAKLWILGVLLPFVALGSYQSYSKQNVEKAKLLEHDVRRSRARLIRNARIFVGDGSVIESGSILLRNGKIEQVYSGNAPDAKSLNAEPVEATGKTILPGLVDMHVHLIASGGMPPTTAPTEKTLARELAAYLYSGVTAVKSAGDPLEMSLQARDLVNSGRRMGSEFFLCGPLFTAEKGHGTEYFANVPERFRAAAEASFVRIPKTPDEAKSMVDALQKDGVNGIKAVLEAGAGGRTFPRLDPGLLKAIADEAHARNLPVTVHTGDSKDVADALHAGTNGIEHGSTRDRTPEELFREMAKAGVFYDPTLSVVEGFHNWTARKDDALNRSLVQQVMPKEMMTPLRKFVATPAEQMRFPLDMEAAKANLLAAWRAGVMLVTGSDAGNPMVFHGPTIQREVELWVEAGIPPAVALQAATYNSAKALHAESRFGRISKGMDATLLIVDGNPLQDIKAMESVSIVFFKGEWVDRSNLFEQD